MGHDHRLCVWDAGAAADGGIGGVGGVGAGDVGSWEAECSVDEAHAKAVNGVALVHARPDGVAAAAAAAAAGTAAAAVAAAAAEGGPRAVTAGGDGVLHIWQVGRLAGGGGAWSAVRLHTLRGHGAAVGAVVCCEEQQLVLSAAADCTLRSWDLASGTH